MIEKMAKTILVLTLAALIICAPVSATTVKESHGPYHSLFLHDDGTVSAFGRNDYGQLGDGTMQEAYDRNVTVDLQEVIDIDAGMLHSLALTRDGTLWAWGNNHFKQLGREGIEYSATPVALSRDHTQGSVRADEFLSIVEEAGVATIFGNDLNNITGAMHTHIGARMPSSSLRREARRGAQAQTRETPPESDLIALVQRLVARIEILERRLDSSATEASNPSSAHPERRVLEDGNVVITLY